MSLSYAQLERFYEGLVLRAREQGVICAITSGMACVAYGVAQATKDCDLLCAPESLDGLFRIVRETKLEGADAGYRGHITPPLDARWLRGGWTSHFVWRGPNQEAYLDVFAFPPRSTEPWESQIEGFYVAPHIVAEMKRTNRGKDWPFVTALGAAMLKARDPRGWLHIFDDQLLLAFKEEAAIPSNLLNRRPLLALAQRGDPRLRAALHAEMQFWHELDRSRIRIYERAVRPYLVAVRKGRVQGRPLDAEHQIRLACAEQHLAQHPLRDYGEDKMIEDARRAVSELIHPDAIQWLPDVREYFKFYA
jgi:hypothetical protein